MQCTGLKKEKCSRSQEDRARFGAVKSLAFWEYLESYSVFGHFGFIGGFTVDESTMMGELYPPCSVRTGTVRASPR